MRGNCMPNERIILYISAADWSDLPVKPEVGGLSEQGPCLQNVVPASQYNYCVVNVECCEIEGVYCQMLMIMSKAIKKGLLPLPTSHITPRTSDIPQTAQLGHLT